MSASRTDSESKLVHAGSSTTERDSAPASDARTAAHDPDTRPDADSDDRDLAALLRKVADVRRPLPRLPVPCTLGDLRIEEVLGRGGMSTVYRAQRLGDPRWLALKTVELADADEAEARLSREAAAIRRIEHEGVVRVHGVERLAGVLTIVMELVEGRSLRRELASERPSTERALDWLVQLVAALAAVHRAGVVHRDLTPSNVLVTPERRLKLIDFGLARVASGDAIDVWRTRTGVRLGTPAYMPPEQWSGAPVTPASDVFAAGLLGFEMLCGFPVRSSRRAPSAGESALDGAAVAALRDAVRARPEVGRVIARSLRHQPIDRHRDACAMEAALSAALA